MKLRAAVALIALSGLYGHAMPAAAATPKVDAKTHDKAVELLGKGVGFRTVMGQGQVPAYAQYLADQLKAGGFAAEDVQVQTYGDTAALVARYRGTGGKRPMLLSAHMDVVEAKPADWTRDPFKLITEGGYFYGRGVYDNKFDVSVIVATLLRLKAEGFKPSRDIILALSGDEETAMVTTRALSKQFPDAELLLNGDAGGGTLAANDKPIAYNLQAAEKTYGTLTIEVTNPGGHSSRPHADNAIYDLAKALDKLAAYQFPAQADELTRAFFRATGKQTAGALGQAMLRFAEDPKDAEAIKVIGADPEYVGMIRTTCVATMLSGGHAENALPQRATATVNCRIFPGVAVEDVRRQVADVVIDPAAKHPAKVEIIGDPTQSPASPLREDVMAAVRKAVDRRQPGLPIVPQMSPGATDSLHFRAEGIPSYGVSGLYMRPTDDFAHGLNERVPVSALDPDLDHWHTLLTELGR
ncbi:M20/M25/M40 family metallo-hydrolase [Lysobacter arenosi]|uniref:M20/M25/M40 family metallo-hydrolase n=1 Tax=Lysobacter arenosi TaxID=2795387 RepID=A0ABX7RDD0_9GAMM|nr:M20/M25/M40 family metallo-hydrolase [Lysobacter arenosi]QSX76162.1 M20/M25/M40 family metallo-hydrolase [Lysobacter arenosi]